MQKLLKFFILNSLFLISGSVYSQINLSDCTPVFSNSLISEINTCLDNNNNILKESGTKSSRAIFNRLNSDQDYNSLALYKKSKDASITWINFEREAIKEFFSKKLKSPEEVQLLQKNYIISAIYTPYTWRLSTYEGSSFLWQTLAYNLCKNIALTKKECIDNIYLKQEFELNQAYSELMIKFSDDTFSDAKQKLILAQRAWAVWRDADIAWQSSSAAYGADLDANQKMLASKTIKVMLIKERIVQLKFLNKIYDTKDEDSSSQNLSLQ